MKKIQHQAWQPNKNVLTRRDEVATLLCDRSTCGKGTDIQWSLEVAEREVNNFIWGMVKK